MYQLTFWARGEEGGERVQFKVGGVTDGNDSIQFPVETEWIKLDKDWQQYVIDLSGYNLRDLVGGFCWVTNKDHNPGKENIQFYLDDIRYERRNEGSGYPLNDTLKLYTIMNHLVTR